MSILYQANTLMRIVGFLSRTLLALIIGFVLGVSYAHGNSVLHSLLGFLA